MKNLTNLKTLFMCLLMVISINVFGQNENRNWIFGNNNRIIFTMGQTEQVSTLPATASNFSTFEGSNVCSNQAGTILFYSNGQRLYDDNDTINTNITNLNGNPSSTSSSITIPYPNTTTDYLLISTTNGDNANGSSIIVRRLNVANNNVTEVINSSVTLNGHYSEKLCAIRLNDRCEYILGAYRIQTPGQISPGIIDFFRINANGVDTTPIASILGLRNGPTAGYMKFSHDGRFFAIMENSVARIYDVTYTNGTPNFTQRKELTGGNLFYGCEFSRNNRYLFISNTGTANSSSVLGSIFRLDLQTINNTSLNINSPAPNTNGFMVLNSTIPNYNNRRYAIGALQLHPYTEQILVASDDDSFLHRINNTNDITPVLELQAISLINRSYLGLPTFISGQVNCNNIEQNTGCCPNQTNLIQNGGFNNPNQNITSDYTRNNAVMPGQYNILPMNQLSRTCSNWNATNQDLCNNGNVLVVNGRTQQANDNNNRVVSFDFQKERWGQYRLCFDVQSLNNCCFNNNAPLNVEYYEIGENRPRQILPITLNPENCGWTRVSLNITTGSSSTMGRIVIRLGQTIISDGNDFAFDNFSLTNIVNFESEIRCDNCLSSNPNNATFTLVNPSNYNPTNQYCWIIGEIDNSGNMINLMSGGTLIAWANFLNIPFNNSWGISTTFNGYNRQVGKTYRVIFYSNPISECDNGSWSGFEFRSMGSNFRILNHNEVEKSLLKINPKIIEFKQDIIIKHKDIKKNSNSKMEDKKTDYLIQEKNNTKN